MNNIELRTGLQNSSYLAIGHAVSLIIQLLGFVYIARELGARDYGYYATVGAFVAFFVLFTFGGLTRVALRESSKDPNKMARVLNSLIGTKTVFAFLSLFLCIIAVFFMPYEHQLKFLIITFSFQLIINSYQSFIDIILLLLIIV